jgi:hypothetical protein
MVAAVKRAFIATYLLEFLQEERCNPEFLRRKSAVSDQHSAFSPNQISKTLSTQRKGGSGGEEGLLTTNKHSSRLVAGFKA